MLTAQTLRFVLLLQIITRYQILGDMQSLILSFDRLINIFCGSTVQILVCVAIGLDSILHNNILLLLIVCSVLSWFGLVTTARKGVTLRLRFWIYGATG